MPQMELPELPRCSRQPKICSLCDIMRLIFDSAAQEDPGCPEVIDPSAPIVEKDGSFSVSYWDATTS